ncbi:MAG: PHP domain-containing protein [Ruminococcaceae bacterium]|nr:PHP domain-containing protein [Oscillospiraceae bacterium]
MLKIDSHNHTTHSHDAVCSPEALCEGALKFGLDGIVISDHADIQDYTDINSIPHILASVADARRLNGKLKVLAGVELGEAVWDAAKAAEIVAAIQPDAVLSSVHAVRYGQYTECFSRIDFTDWTAEMLDEYMTQYFADMQEMVERVDMDILTHLSNPVKYINGRYGKGISLAPYSAAVDKILKTVIEKEISLELNLALVGTSYSVTMPEADIMARYRQLGGRCVTIGSDAHVETRVGVNFDYGIKVLRSVGFDSYNYYEGRERKTVKFA